MSRSAEDFVVEDRKYRTTQFDARTGVKVLTQFTKLLGKPIAKLLGDDINISRVKDVLKQDLFFSSAIEALAEVADEDRVQTLIDNLLSTTQIYNDDGSTRPINFNIDFTCRYKQLFTLLKDIAAFQFADFFLKSKGEEGKPSK